MTTDFNVIADEYQDTKENVIKKYSEEYSFFAVLGDVQSLSIIDFACGDGYYTRMFKQRGASQLVGIDISEHMIANARQIEAENPLGIEYRVHNVATLGQIGQFDLATAVFLFGYATTREELNQMNQTIYDNLKPGGRLVGVTLHPAMTVDYLSILGQYGSKMRADKGLVDGQPVTVIIDTPKGPLEFSNYYWTTDSFENSFQQAGFQEVVWHPMKVSPAGLSNFSEGFWQPYLDKPALIVFECRK